METNMSEDTRTIHIVRNGRELAAAVELVHSPDDGGYYLGNTDFVKGRQRVSLNVWPSGAAAVAAFQAGKVQWESWRGG
jgi:hypothetical protein